MGKRVNVSMGDDMYDVLERLSRESMRSVSSEALYWMRVGLVDAKEYTKVGGKLRVLADEVMNKHVPSTIVSPGVLAEFDPGTGNLIKVDTDGVQPMDLYMEVKEFCRRVREDFEDEYYDQELDRGLVEQARALAKKYGLGLNTGLREFYRDSGSEMVVVDDFRRV